MAKEPSSYKEACCHPDWIHAMNQELQALTDNNTWELTDLPPKAHLIGCRWIYKVKLKADGTVDRYKARLVAKGYTQKEGVDYQEVFSPVANLVTVKVFIAMVTAFGWPLHQLDINNAFLHGFLHDEIYMKPPPGLPDVQKNQVCKLLKSLYGLKQASREWNIEFSKQLSIFGFKASPYDPCLYLKGSGDDFLCLLVYVDDIIVSGPSIDSILQLKQFLHDTFTIKDLGEAKFFLGMEIARGTDGTSLSQRKYVLEILSTHGMLCCKPVATPLPPGLILTQGTDDLLSDPEPYRSLVGQLLYLNLTRADITHAAQQLSQFVAKPTMVHWHAAVHVLKYLKGCPSLGVFYPVSQSFKLTAYTDSDWGTCPDTRKSLTGYCIYLGNALLSWKCKKQNIVSSSSAEAEYRAMATTTRELVWISHLISEFSVDISLPIPLYCDNLAAIQITKNPVFHERTKHLDIDCHVVREKFLAGFLTPVAVRSALQLADFFTKPLFGPRFKELLSKMGMLDLHTLHLEGGC